MEHTVIGFRILGPLMRDAPGALSIVRSHHERLNGQGVPDGLAGEAIPFQGRVVAVADAFAAMTSVRPYRPPPPVAVPTEAVDHNKSLPVAAARADALKRATPEPACA